MTGFYMRATLALNGLIDLLVRLEDWSQSKDVFSDL